jgi:hypothetical protein
MKRTLWLPRSCPGPLETGDLEARPLRVVLCSTIARSLDVVFCKRLW